MEEIIRKVNRVDVWRFARNHGTTVQTVYRHIKNGKIPPEAVGERFIKRITIDENAPFKVRKRRRLTEKK